MQKYPQVPQRDAGVSEKAIILRWQRGGKAGSPPHLLYFLIYHGAGLMTLLCTLTVQRWILRGATRFITSCGQLITVRGAFPETSSRKDKKNAGTAKETPVSDKACKSQDFHTSQSIYCQCCLWPCRKEKNTREHQHFINTTMWWELCNMRSNTSASRSRDPLSCRNVTSNQSFQIITKNLSWYHLPK